MTTLKRDDIAFYPADEAWTVPSFDTVKASSARWDIVTSHTLKPIWIGTGDTLVTQVSRPYKIGDPPRLTLSSSFVDRAKQLESAIFAWMKRELCGTVMNGIMMTEQTIHSMLPQSDDALKCALNEKECAFFDADGKPTEPYGIEEGNRYKFAIHPTALWCFRKQVGIKWYIRQVRRNEKRLEPEPDDWSL